MASGKLNAKQARFVEEYLIDLNATQAAIRAGYSESTAYSQGQRLLKHVEVAKAVKSAVNDRSQSTGVTAEIVIAGLLREAKGDGVEDTSASARVSAWEKLGKHVGIFEKDNAQSRPVMPTHIAIVSPKLDDDPTD